MERDGESIWFDAIRAGDFRTMRRVKPLYLGTRDGSGRTGLMHATRCGQRAIVTELMSERGQSDDSGKTALIYAVIGFSNDLIDVLISEAGMQTSWSQTATMLACEIGNSKAVEKLYDKELHISDHKGFFAVDYALKFSNEHVVRFILAYHDAAPSAPLPTYSGVGFQEDLRARYPYLYSEYAHLFELRGHADSYGPGQSAAAYASLGCHSSVPDSSKGADLLYSRASSGIESLRQAEQRLASVGVAQCPSAGQPCAQLMPDQTYPLLQICPPCPEPALPARQLQPQPPSPPPAQMQGSDLLLSGRLSGTVGPDQAVLVNASALNEIVSSLRELQRDQQEVRQLVSTKTKALKKMRSSLDDLSSKMDVLSSSVANTPVASPAGSGVHFAADTKDVSASDRHLSELQCRLHDVEERASMLEDLYRAESQRRQRTEAELSRVTQLYNSVSSDFAAVSQANDSLCDVVVEIESDAVRRQQENASLRRSLLGASLHRASSASASGINLSQEEPAASRAPDAGQQGSGELRYELLK